VGTLLAFLVVIDGDHRREVALEGTAVTIGRAADCEVVLPADETVSRRHARLDRCGAGEDSEAGEGAGDGVADQAGAGDGGGWTVTDLGSRNGTFVNGRRVAATTPIGNDDRVLVGGYVLLVRSDQRAESETRDGSAGALGAGVRSGLSAREVDVVRLVCAGLGDQAIAEQLFLSVKTVQSHLDRIGQKTGHRRRPELVRFAMEHGLA
jgi:DNA-binding CsgD family transcriptional regulator